jgi:hypothetical protein
MQTFGVKRVAQTIEQTAISYLTRGFTATLSDGKSRNDGHTVLRLTK